jgi:bacterioferritin
MEIESVMSYTANSINPDGVRAREVVEHLEEDIQDELGHAQQFGRRSTTSASSSSATTWTS